MFAALVKSTPSPADTLDDIGRAFHAAIERQGGTAFGVGALVVALVMVLSCLRWLLRETRNDRLHREELAARRAAALADPAGRREQRQLVRVPAQVGVTVRQADGADETFYARCKTQDVSGGGVAFLSDRPPSPGLPVQLTLDIGESGPVSLRAVVVRVDPPPSPGMPSLVATRLGPITSRDRERVVQWVSRQLSRGLAQARRGRSCPVCRRPLADDAGEMHASCALKLQQRSGSH